jgi:hypothetical protein
LLESEDKERVPPGVLAVFPIKVNAPLLELTEYKLPEASIAYRPVKVLPNVSNAA